MNRNISYRVPPLHPDPSLTLRMTRADTRENPHKHWEFLGSVELGMTLRVFSRAAHAPASSYSFRIFISAKWRTNATPKPVNQA
jgi:hypothetical protein